MILALTGAFGCGKSTALKAFQSRSWQICDADGVCHELYQDPESELCRKIRGTFGPACAPPGEAVNRKALGDAVFRDPEALNKLTALVHPVLFRELEKRLARCRAGNISAVCEVPLLYETGKTGLFDAVCTLWCPAELRHERLKQFRHFSDEEIARREAMQMEPDKKLELADFGFINNGSPAWLQWQIDQFLR